MDQKPKWSRLHSTLLPGPFLIPQTILQCQMLEAGRYAKQLTETGSDLRYLEKKFRLDFEVFCLLSNLLKIFFLCRLGSLPFKDTAASAKAPPSLKSPGASETVGFDRFRAWRGFRFVTFLMVSPYSGLVWTLQFEDVWCILAKTTG